MWCIQKAIELLDFKSHLGLNTSSNNIRVYILYKKSKYYLGPIIQSPNKSYSIIQKKICIYIMQFTVLDDSLQNWVSLYGQESVFSTGRWQPVYTNIKILFTKFVPNKYVTFKNQIKCQKGNDGPFTLVVRLL